jgi:hypothetical protein
MISAVTNVQQTLSDRSTNRNNHVKIVVVQQPFDLTDSLGSNCQVFLDSCLGREFVFFINVLDMETYVLLGGR